MEVVVQRVVGDEVVDEEAVVLGDAVADEGDEVAVVDAADDLHLRLELPLPLPAAALELLHRHRLAVRERPLEHAPEPALPEELVAREPRRDVVQLVERERLGVPHAQLARRRHAPRRPAPLAPRAVVRRLHRPRRRRRPQERGLAGHVLRRVRRHREARVVPLGLPPPPPLRQAGEHAGEAQEGDHDHDHHGRGGSGAQPAADGRCRHARAAARFSRRARRGRCARPGRRRWRGRGVHRRMPWWWRRRRRRVGGGRSRRRCDGWRSRA
ncbi:Os06g0488125 [Oryza sativa Japonica Group]|uniref:Os06g0488125 protein n=1 Tax=Oryza sativa subsp. japonica TaxID=39947 RepID=A0A0P0WWU8_ORYSJ|nr:hypothetical protein EE612_034247 [Oryza sativa]BAS97845.1 Os06g0488125 [Oryza sativa Japonica Group]